MYVPCKQRNRVPLDEIPNNFVDNMKFENSSNTSTSHSRNQSFDTGVTQKQENRVSLDGNNEFDVSSITEILERRIRKDEKNYINAHANAKGDIKFESIHMPDIFPINHDKNICFEDAALDRNINSSSANVIEHCLPMDEGPLLQSLEHL